MVLILLFLSLTAHSSVSLIPNKYRGLTTKEVKKILEKRKKKSRISDSISIKSSSVKRNSRRLLPYFSNRTEKIRPLERFYGVIDGNIKVIGSETQIVKVEVENNSKIPRDSYLVCEVTNRAIYMHYRMDFICSKLVTRDSEYRINALIRDLKKIQGITPDFVSVGEDISTFKSIVSGAVSSLVDVSKDRVLTEQGFQVKPTYKNSLRDSAANTIKDLGKNKSGAEPQLVLALADRKRAIIEFVDGFEFKRGLK